MPNLTASIPHQLTRAEVKRRIHDQIGMLRRQRGALLANIQETWKGDAMDFSLSVMSHSISGHLAVDDQMVHLEVALPWLLSMLAASLKQRVEQQGRLLLSSVPAKETPSGGKK